MRFLVGVVVSCLAFGAATGRGRADDGAALAQKFGAMPMVNSISVAPDASKIAFTTMVEAGTVLFVADVVTGGPPRRILTFPRTQGTIDGCKWSMPDRLVCDAK